MENQQLPTLQTKSLSPQDLDDHRSEIGVLCELTYKKLDKFGWDQMERSMRIAIRKDWMDALAPYTIPEINLARRQFTLDKPSKIPNEGHLRQIIISARKSAVRARSPAPRSQQVERKVVKPEAADEIMRQAGFRPKSMTDAS